MGYPASALRDSRGTASLEAALMLPVLAMVWIALFHFGALYDARQRQLATARRCAWLYAQRGCEAVPADCEDVESEWDATPDGASGLVGGLRGTLKSLPLADRVLEVLGDSFYGEGIVAESRQRVPAPRVLGSDVDVVARQFMLCNEKPRELDELTTDFFSDLFGGLP